MLACNVVYHELETLVYYEIEPVVSTCLLMCACNAVYQDIETRLILWLSVFVSDTRARRHVRVRGFDGGYLLFSEYVCCGWLESSQAHGSHGNHGVWDRPRTEATDQTKYSPRVTSVRMNNFKKKILLTIV